MAAQIETKLTGQLTRDVQRNMHVELAVSLAYGAFFAASVSFIPVVLRNLGASAAMLAAYTSLLFVGSVLASGSIVLMRRRRPMNVIVACWVIGRSLFLLCAFITQASWMIAVSAAFWVLESFPSPGYTRVVQKIYPEGVRGKIMSTVRMGRVAAILVVTPLAGWALDAWGYRVLFPLAAVSGVAAGLLFGRIRADEGPLPPRQTKALTELWGILRDDHQFTFYLICFVLFGTGTLMAYTLYPIVQVDRLGLSYGQIGLLGLFQSAAWLLSYFFWGKMVDRYGGVFVLRGTCAVTVLIPVIYMFADSMWMLLPAFIAQGIVSGGFDMGTINAGIQMADLERVTEYAALQTTTVGLRGLIAPQIGIVLLALGVPQSGVFALAALLIAAAWVLFGFVRAPVPGDPEFAAHGRLRYRWPIRFRTPRI